MKQKISPIEPLEARIAPAFTNLFVNALNGTNGFTMTGGTQAAIIDHDYTMIANAGDVNGDGIDDLLVGSDTYQTGNGSNGLLGAVAVIFGRRDGFPANLDFGALGTYGALIRGQGKGFATAIGGAGDVNGDGFDDIILGASNAGASADGEAFVVFGRAVWPASQNTTDLNGTNGFKISGDSRTSPGGIAPAVGGGTALGNGRGGDFNADGFADVLIGAPDLKAFAQSGAGGAFVIFGHAGAFPANLSTANLNGTNGTLLASNSSSDHSGTSVGWIGDVNQDGRADFAMGGIASNNGYHTFVIFGQATSPALVNISTLTAAQGFDIPTLNPEINPSGSPMYPGVKVVQRDIDGDGDLDLGVPFNFFFDRLEGYVWAKNTGAGFSKNPFTAPEKLTRHLLLNFNNGAFGTFDSEYDPGDFNGDGVTDYLAFVPSAQAIAIYDSTLASGTKYINNSNGSGIVLQDPTIDLQNTSDAGRFNYIGDINGDGLDDVAWIPPTEQVVKEALIIFGTNLKASTDNRTYTYTDVDGDIVTVKTTKGQLDPLMFSLVSQPGAVLGGKLLQKLDLALALGVDGFDPSGATITITAKPGPLGGDGFVNVGDINAAGLNLGAVTVAGDLGRITAGTAAVDRAAITTLTVQSLGRLGLTSQLVGGSLQSNITGPLTKLVVANDIDGATINVIGTDATIGSVTVKHSLVGGATTGSGSILTLGSIGAVTVGGNLIGGAGETSGAIHGGSIQSAKISGSIIGGAGLASATLAAGGTNGTTGTIGAVTVLHDVRGGVSSGGVSATGAISSVKITGNLIGGTGDFSGSLSSTTSIGAVTITGNLEAGKSGRTGILAGGSLGAVKISGSVFGTAAVPAFISSGSDARSSELKSLTVSGSVHFATVQAGFDMSGEALTSVDAQVGKVVVNGDWIGSSISAGVKPGGDGKFGTVDDRVIPGVSATVFSKIASIAISGEARGTDGGSDSYAFTAEQIGSLKVGKTKFPLTTTSANVTTEDELNVGPTFDLRLRELDAVTPLAPIAFTAFTGGTRAVSEDGKTFTYSDVDGDDVTVKTDKGKFDLANFQFAAGTNLLQRINLNSDADFIGKKANLTITAVRNGTNGGDGWADIGAIDFTGVDLVKITASGDIGVIDGGTNPADGAALGTLSLHSLGGRGLKTQAAGGSLHSDIAGSVTTLTVATDIDGAAFVVGGKLTKATVSGSIIGGATAAELIAMGDLTSATVKGDIRGGSVLHSGRIFSTGKIGAITVSGSLVGGSAEDTGNIEGEGGLGSVTVNRSLFGSSGEKSGSIIAGGSITSVKVNGDMIGGSGDYSGSIFADAPASDLGAIGSVAVKGSILAGNSDFMGIFSGSTLGAITVSGDVRGTTGASVKIVAEGLAAPATAAKALAIKSVAVTGVVQRLDILAGFETGLDLVRSDVQIGAITAKANWSASNVLAGVDYNGAAITDVNADIVSRIASLTITGSVLGVAGAAPSDAFLISAQEIGAMKIGSSKFPFTTSSIENFQLANAPDVRVREVA